MKDPDAKLISSVSNIIYLTNFLGFSSGEREAFVLIFKDKKFLITDKRYSEAARKQTKGFEIIDNGAIKFIANDAKEFFKKRKIKTLGIEEYDLRVSEYKLLKKVAKIVPIDNSKLRIFKSNSEIQNIKKACRIGDQAFKFILGKLKVGIAEKEIANELVNFFQTKNADYSFEPIIAFGKNSSVPHHKSGNTKLKKNQIVLLDFGVKVNNYCSDMTRTVFFGKAPEKFKDIYKAVLNSQQLAITKVKHRVKASVIDKAARDYILSKNYPNIIHAVGHGIGLQVHEAPTLSPISRDKLENNMVFSVEPGIYISEYGGVRIEDLVLVSNGLPELISHASRVIIEVDDK